MEQENHQAIFEETGRQLGLIRPESFATGAQVEIGGVDVRLIRSPGRSSAFLVCELGSAIPSEEATVHKALLEMQLAIGERMDAFFGRDGLNDRLMFMARIPLNPSPNVDDLTGIVEGLTSQVADWKSKVLGGMLFDFERWLDSQLPDSPMSVAAALEA